VPFLRVSEQKIILCQLVLNLVDLNHLFNLVLVSLFLACQILRLDELFLVIFVFEIVEEVLVDVVLVFNVKH
jgi:hypothetical protein